MKQDLQNRRRSVAENRAQKFVGEIGAKKENRKLYTVDVRWKVRRRIVMMIMKVIRTGT
jgi:hypothetical protein